MIAMAKVLSDAEVKAAADYFASLKPSTAFNKVVETDTVAKSYVGAGGMRFASATAATEPIGNRIIVLPQDPERAHLRDPKIRLHRLRAEGQHRQGRSTDGAAVTARPSNCTICHGPTLQGLGEVPGITGRPATYMFRQLNDMKTGNRNGPWIELMKQVVEKLDRDDMIALAAYPRLARPRNGRASSTSAT